MNGYHLLLVVGATALAVNANRISHTDINTLVEEAEAEANAEVEEEVNATSRGIMLLAEANARIATQELGETKEIKSIYLEVFTKIGVPEGHELKRMHLCRFMITTYNLGSQRKDWKYVKDLAEDGIGLSCKGRFPTKACMIPGKGLDMHVATDFVRNAFNKAAGQPPDGKGAMYMSPRGPRSHGGAQATYDNAIKTLNEAGAGELESQLYFNLGGGMMDEKLLFNTPMSNFLVDSGNHYFIEVGPV